MSTQLRQDRHTDCWSPDRAPSRHHLHAPIRRQDAAWRKKDPRTGNERERLTPGQVQPRRLFLRAFPIGSQSALAQECRLSAIRFENRDEHARPRRQRKRLFRSDLPFLVDFSFDSWEHGVKSTSVSSSPSKVLVNGGPACYSRTALRSSNPRSTTKLTGATSGASGAAPCYIFSLYSLKPSTNCRNEVGLYFSKLSSST